MIEKAIEFALEKHKGQLDDSGKPYFTHLFQVYHLLAEVTEDENVLCAGILHDTLEDTNTSWEELASNFNEEIANLVKEVSHQGKKDEYGYYFPNLHSEKGILIKFADRLSNLSRMKPWPEQRKKQYLTRSKFWKDGSELQDKQEYPANDKGELNKK